MEAKIEKISELSKLLSVKTRMSDDLFHLFGRFGIGHLFISPFIGEIGQIFRFRVDPFSLPLRKHPILAAFVWASSFTTFARKTYVCTQRNKCFSGLLHSRGHASGYSSPVPTGTQQ